MNDRQVRIKHWWNDTDGKTRVLGNDLSQYRFFPPQIPRGLPWD